MKITLIVVVAALLIGIGAAVIVSLQTPAAPKEEPIAETPSAPAAPTVEGPPAPAIPTTVPTAPGPRHTTASGLTIIEVREGTGPAAKVGDTVAVNYVGRLYAGGKQFDSSYDRGQPIEFPLGQGQVIKGWDEGVAGMKVGEKRQLIIPPDLGYGDAGAGGGAIPPSATLLFDVELMQIKPGT
jgi:peptidylprolyl isomerase